jgi:hypothetical protein
MASNIVASSTSVFTSLLTSNSLTTNLVFLCYDLHQWGLLCLPRLHQGWLSHNSFRLGLVCLPAKSLYTGPLQSYVTTNGHSASLSWCQAPIWGPRPEFYYCQTVAGLLLWGAHYDEGTGLSFTTVAGPRQCSHSLVRVLRNSWPYFSVLDSRLPQTGGPGPRIYIPQEQGGTVIPPGIVFPFRHLLRLAGLRWRYSNPPPPMIHLSCWSLWYSLGTDPTESTFSCSCNIAQPQSCQSGSHRNHCFW